MIDLALDALAAFRLTRLATLDSLLDHPRAEVIRFAYRKHDDVDDALTDQSMIELAIGEHGDAPKLATLVTCPWCAAVWAAAGVVAARQAFPRQSRMLRDALAVAAIVGFLSEWSS